MSRLSARRRNASSLANNNNNSGDEDLPKAKISRTGLCIFLPKRSRVVGNVLVCGQGDLGQLGLGEDDTKFERKRPALLESIESAVDICAGGVHNLVITNSGQVYSFGCNDEGALGRETSEDGSEFVPKLVNLPGKGLKISAGDSHSACLLEDGRVFAWGSFRDSHGNMGLTLDGNKRLPIDVLPGFVCVDIASGADHLVILTQAGKAFTVGCGEQGQLGRVSMRSASGESRRGKTELLRPAEIHTRIGKLFIKIWATNYCTFLREQKTDQIWACGLNNYMQLAVNKQADILFIPTETNFKDIKQVAGGQHHTLVLAKNGSVHVIGRRDYGRLGLGVLSEDLKELREVEALKGVKIVSISCGEAQSFALSEDGKLYAWGMGSSHQLGTGEEDDVLEPVQIVSKQTQNKRIVRVSSGGQHSIFIVQEESHRARKPAPLANTKSLQTIAETENASDREVATEAQNAIADTENATETQNATKTEIATEIHNATAIQIAPETKLEEITNATEKEKETVIESSNSNAVPDLAMEETLEENVTAVEKEAADEQFEVTVKITSIPKNGPEAKETVLAVNETNE